MAKRYLVNIILLVCIFTLSGSAPKTNKDVPLNKPIIHNVQFDKVKIVDNFWSPRLKAHSQNTLKTCIAQMEDSTKRIQNFIRAAGDQVGKHEGIYFDDSDVYKAMEGLSYSLVNNPNPYYEELLDRWIDYIARAQMEDGYINTFYTLNHPHERWSDMEKHEMYCGGHLIEAAIAHYFATGKTSFLNVAVKFADHIVNYFGPGKRIWVPGHQEIELALVKLYNVTKQEKYLEMAHWLLEQRGRGHGQGSIWSKSQWGSAYCQDDVPVNDIADIKGHAVRAMYMFTGMADVAAEKKLDQYIEALNRVWEDVVYRNMYITGGIGSSKSNEGFTEDYDLPNKTAYCETCAAIGMVFWNNRMNLLTKNAKYVDILERALYNGLLSGVSLDGDLYFYVNPLESDGNHHRQRWFGCACCPSNISRFIPSIGNYIYATGDDKVFVNLFVASETTIEINNVPIKLIQKTSYPWTGEVNFEIHPDAPVEFDLHIRVPGWCKSYSVANGEGNMNKKFSIENGYLKFSKKWGKNEKFSISFDMPVELMKADYRVKENINKRAVQKGPLVYCIEEVDNKSADWDGITINSNAPFTISPGEGKLEGMTLLVNKSGAGELTFIPYFAWDNRNPGKMKVWIPFSESQSLYTP